MVHASGIWQMGAHFLWSWIPQKWCILVTKNIAGSKIRLISNIEQKFRVTYDLQDGGHVVAKMEISQNFGNLKKWSKMLISGNCTPLTSFMVKLSTRNVVRIIFWNILDNKNFTTTRKFRTMMSFWPKMTSFETQNGPISHKITSYVKNGVSYTKQFVTYSHNATFSLKILVSNLIKWITS